MDVWPFEMIYPLGSVLETMPPVFFEMAAASARPAVSRAGPR
jgi:hypothetical protein